MDLKKGYQDFLKGEGLKHKKKKKKKKIQEVAFPGKKHIFFILVALTAPL